jgi:hypothetical protein
MLTSEREEVSLRIYYVLCQAKIFFSYQEHWAATQGGYRGKLRNQSTRSIRCNYLINLPTFHDDIYYFTVSK